MPRPLPSVFDRAVLFLALVLRVTAVAVHPVTASLFSDMGNYAALGDDIVHGVWKPTHFYQPVGFSYLLSILKRLPIHWGVSLTVLHVVLSMATVWLVWRAADRAFGSRAGRIALVVSAIHAPWISLTSFTLPETMFSFLMALLLHVSLDLVVQPSRRWSAAWGLVFIAAFWLKGTHVFLGPIFLLGFVMWQGWSRNTILNLAAPLCAVVAAGLLLHGVVSYRAIGRFQLSGSAGGLNFVEGKCPSKRNFDSTGAVWWAPIYAQLNQTASKIWDRPFTDSSYFMQEGAKCIRDNPAVLVQSLENIPFLVMGNFLWPATEVRLAWLIRLYELWFAPWLLVGLAAWVRLRWPLRREQIPDVLVWALPAVALCVCVYVFKSEIRFRVPFDVWLIPMSAQGWAWLSSVRGDSPAA